MAPGPHSAQVAGTGAEAQRQVPRPERHMRGAVVTLRAPGEACVSLWGPLEVGELAAPGTQLGDAPGSRSPRGRPWAPPPTQQPQPQTLALSPPGAPAPTCVRCEQA